MTNFFPSLIPVGTTSIVTVRGKDFVASSELYCSFGGEVRRPLGHLLLDVLF